MSSLREVLGDYLRMRRALGYKLDGPDRLLDQFVTYLEQTGALTVTIENAVAWATQPAGADPGYWGARLSVAPRMIKRNINANTTSAQKPASSE